MCNEKRKQYKRTAKYEKLLGILHLKATEKRGARGNSYYNKKLIKLNLFGTKDQSEKKIYISNLKHSDILGQSGCRRCVKQQSKKKKGVRYINPTYT